MPTADAKKVVRGRVVTTREGDATKRIVFTFSPESLAGLERVRKRLGKKVSMAEAVRVALQLTDSLQTQALHGYNEVVVRNPSKDREKVLAGMPLVADYSDAK